MSETLQKPAAKPRSSELKKLADNLQKRVDTIRESVHTDREDAIASTLEIIVKEIKQ